MNFINNAWAVSNASLATTVGRILGAVLAIYGVVQVSKPEIQTALYFSYWQDWVPFVLAIAAALGIQVARAVVQPSVTAAVNKP